MAEHARRAFKTPDQKTPRRESTKAARTVGQRFFAGHSLDIVNTDDILASSGAAADKALHPFGGNNSGNNKCVFASSGRAESDRTIQIGPAKQGCQQPLGPADDASQEILMKATQR